MVCDGPDPPENSSEELSPIPTHVLLMSGAWADAADSDEEPSDHEGYQPLPQGPDHILAGDVTDDDHDEDIEETQEATENVPPIETMERILTRDVWNTPRPPDHDPIVMDEQRAQQVMSAMANFSLPESSIPEWARCLTHDYCDSSVRDLIQRLQHDH